MLLQRTCNRSCTWKEYGTCAWAESWVALKVLSRSDHLNVFGVSLLFTLAVNLWCGRHLKATEAIFLTLIHLENEQEVSLQVAKRQRAIQLENSAQVSAQHSHPAATCMPPPQVNNKDTCCFCVDVWKPVRHGLTNKAFPRQGIPYLCPQYERARTSWQIHCLACAGGQPLLCSLPAF